MRLSCSLGLCTWLFEFVRSRPSQPSFALSLNTANAILIGLIICCAPGIQTVSAQDTIGVGGLSGTVKPPVALQVCLAGLNRCVQANAQGDFHFVDLRPGDYTLEVTPTGKATIRSAVVAVRAGLEAQIDVTLPTIDAIKPR